MSLNRAMLIGNLGRDAELKYTGSGVPVVSFSMAMTEKWKDRNGERQEKTEWLNIVYWGDAAKAVVEYLTKGKMVFVEGSIQTRKWQDKEGRDRFTTDIKARSVQLLGGRPEGGARSHAHEAEPEEAAPTTQGYDQPAAEAPYDDSVPF